MNNFDRWIADPRDLTFGEFLCEAKPPNVYALIREGELHRAACEQAVAAEFQRRLGAQALSRCLGDGQP